MHRNSKNFASFSFSYLVELNYVRVANLFQNVDFSCYSFYIAFILYAIFLENFDGDFLSRDGVGSDSDLAEGARAERSP